jgi:hypothetical protein
MYFMMIVQIRSSLAMKWNKNMFLRIKINLILLFVGTLVSCGNRNENSIAKSNNELDSSSVYETYYEPDIKITIDGELQEHYKFKRGLYHLYKSVTNNTSEINMIFSNEVKNHKEIDSTDLPVKELGEYKNIEIKFVDDKFVNLKLKSYLVEKDPDFNVKENWLMKCEIVEGSKSIFDNGGNITLKFLNSNEYDSSNSVLLKGYFSKSLRFSDLENSTSVVKTSENQIVCNKKEISWKVKSNYIGKFALDPEYKELYKQ